MTIDKVECKRKRNIGGQGQAQDTVPTYKKRPQFNNTQKQ